MNPYDPTGHASWETRFPPHHRSPNYDITDDDLGKHGVNGRAAMTVLPDGPNRMFKRRAVRQAGSSQAHNVGWLVGELDGVRCYLVEQAGGRLGVVMTKRDLWP